MASADATLTLSVGASVVDVLRWANGKGAVLGSDGFYSGQDLLVLCRQSIVQMGIYTQALGEGLDNWHQGSLSMDKKRKGAIRRQQVNGMVVLIGANQGL